MVLLTLELSGNATSAPRHTFILDHPLSFSKATLVGIDLHAPSPGLSQSWTSTQTGDDYPQNRTAYAPLYVDIEGIADHAQVNHGFRNRGWHPMVGIAIARKRTN